MIIDFEIRRSHHCEGGDKTLMALRVGVALSGIGNQIPVGKIERERETKGLRLMRLKR